VTAIASPAQAFKAKKEQEKALFEAVAPVLQNLVGEETPKQVELMYSLQLLCFSSSHPKGMMLRFSTCVHAVCSKQDIVFVEFGGL
jgi:hypothetical protein